jgi:DNA polymerase-3 subunit epsilon
MGENSILRARRILQSNPLFFDTETTGLDSGAEIVEIGVVDVDGQSVLESLVRPCRRIPSGATAVHGISDDMVLDAPTWVEIWPQLKRLLADRRVGIFNADFDLRMMRQSHEQHGLTWEAMGGSAFCVMKMYARFYGELRSQGNFKWQSLQKAGQQCGISLPNSHRAADDARLACAVFRHMARTDNSS